MHAVDVPDFVSQFQIVDPMPFGSWLLRIEYDNPEIGLMYGTSLLKISLSPPYFRGKSIFNWRQSDVVGPDIDCEIDGILTDTTVEFVLHLAGDEWRYVVFKANGEKTDSTQFSGKWRVDCINPETCNGGCQGAKGDFTFCRECPP